MASGAKRKTTMAKRDRERKLHERRQEKAARKAERKLAAEEGEAPAPYLAARDDSDPFAPGPDSESGPPG
jgi:hypothetical protein